eukprot:932060-Pleurochrysis_carterae.AAC.1
MSLLLLRRGAGSAEDAAAIGQLLTQACALRPRLNLGADDPDDAFRAERLVLRSWEQLLSRVIGMHYNEERIRGGSGDGGGSAGISACPSRSCGPGDPSLGCRAARTTRELFALMNGLMQQAALVVPRLPPWRTVLLEATLLREAVRLSDEGVLLPAAPPRSDGD